MATEKSKICMDLRRKKAYNNPVDGLACPLREVVGKMASQQKPLSRTVKGSLHDEDGTWVVRGRVFDPITGKTKNRSKTTGYMVKNNTKRRAGQRMKEIIAQWEHEANAEPVKNDPLFSECVEKWLQDKSSSIRQNTAAFYRQYADCYIIPALGNVKIRDMTYQSLRAYYDEQLERLSVSSVKKQHLIINGAIKKAVADGVIPANFASSIKFPKAKRYEGKAYSEEQVARLLSAAAQEGEPIYSAIVFAVCYGLRRSEICGLIWEDIDFEHNTLNVRHTKTKFGSLIIDAEQVKSDASRRTIDLMESTIPYLRSLKKTQEQHGLISGKVCIWPDGSEVDPDYITRKSSYLMKKTGLEHIRLHDLRHTAASLLAVRVTPKQLQRFMGHENISVTMDIYTHLFDKDRKATSDVMDDILKKTVFCSEKCSDSESTKNRVDSKC